ncbi:hypothetical protein AB0A94_37705 [Streptomyces sp. NPDC044984]|uniref:hypothetical protein n=1 Tax=Streptomyces sp. NPDC044984 TaxID=3154335 RepID=UPI0033F46ECD
MFQETPIYSRLITERGDVPAQVCGEADRIHRHLAQMLHRAPAFQPSAPRNVFEPKTPPAVS